MKRRRVVVTGISAIAPNGIGIEKFWLGIKNGVSGINKITRFDASKFSVQIAGEINDFDHGKYINVRDSRRMDRYTQLGVSAGKMAFDDAKLAIQERENFGVIMGTSIGGQGWQYFQNENFNKGKILNIHPFTSIAVYPNALSTEVSIALKLKGPSETISCGCASAVIGVDSALRMIREGAIDGMVVGGAEAPIVPPILGALCASQNLSLQNSNPNKASRPYDIKRDGLVISEGAAVLVLENLEYALKRKAYIYGEIVGSGLTCDAYNAIKPDESAVQPARAIQNALKDAAIKPENISYICANGLSLKLSDIVETNAIKKIFGKFAYKIPISSIKSSIGQPFAAAGALQIVASILAIKNKVIPPTINYENPDPECDLDYTPNQHRLTDLKYVLINAFAFGGKNAAIIIKKI